MRSSLQTSGDLQAMLEGVTAKHPLYALILEKPQRRERLLCIRRLDTSSGKIHFLTEIYASARKGFRVVLLVDYLDEPVRKLEAYGYETAQSHSSISALIAENWRCRFDALRV